jgi:periplasmic divalent cation tolerance protein
MSESVPSDVLIALCTCPNAESAERIATALVTEKLAACVNQLPGVRSTYWWQDQVQTDEEIQLVIKTTTAKLATVEARIKALHPYAVPELIAVPVVGGSSEYLEWVRRSVEGIS